ncbi:MAG: hypothetical protein M1814_000394 [Vezdaea aestivalis]|nr:MAG: hypothetical protein M1814_000394 [Vezdaea aestivalis]
MITESPSPTPIIVGLSDTLAVLDPTSLLNSIVASITPLVSLDPSSGIIPTNVIGTDPILATPTPLDNIVSIASSLLSSVTEDLASVLSTPLPLATDLPPALSSVISAITDLPTTIPPGVLPTDNVVPTGTIPSLSDILPTITPSEILPTITPSEILPTITPSEVPSVVPTPTPTITDGILPTGIPTGVVPEPSLSTPSSIPSTPLQDPALPTNITDALLSTPTQTGLTSDVTPLTTSLPATGVVSETPAVSLPESLPPASVTSIVPVSTNDLTALVIPSSIVTQSEQPSNVVSTAPPTTSETGIPTSLPRLITPYGGPVSQPANTTLIQVGFVYALNYPFVVSSPTSSSQLFTFLPQGIAYGLNISVGDVKMTALRPYDTTKDLGFITTLALAWIPTDLVNTLLHDIHTPPSAFYNNPEPSVNTLLSMINPTFPIIAGMSLDPGTPGSPLSPTATAAGGDGSPLGNTPAAQTGVRGTSIGIGVSVVAGAVLYGAAMFYIARRYKKRRQRHVRSPSMADANVDGGASSGALMAGAFVSGGRGTPRPHGSGSGGRESRGSGRSNGNSARTAQISGPMTAENSLGWN